MCTEFYIKNRKKILTYEKVLTVNEALELLEKKLIVYNFDFSDKNFDKVTFFNSSLSIDYDCIQLGDGYKSARGFELYYVKEENMYGIRLAKPYSRDDWFLALKYIKELAKRLNSKIASINDGVLYTIDTIDSFDYESDILSGIENIFLDSESNNTNICGIDGVNRLVTFDKEMIDKICNSDSPIDIFSNMVKEVQYLDAHSAKQNFIESKFENKYVGSYVFSNDLRMIFPYKPYIESQNLSLIKENEEVIFWNITLVTINGDKSDQNNYHFVGDMKYKDFIKKLPANKYKFIDALYIMVEPLSEEEILELLK